MSTLTVYPGDVVSVLPTPIPPAPPVPPAAFGTYATNTVAPWNQSSASGFTAYYGTRPSLVHTFVPIVDTTTAPSNEKTNRALFDLAWAQDAHANGAIPIFSHELRDHRVPQRTFQQAYSLDRWISGANDPALIAWLTAAGVWGERFVYRVGWEMTGWDYTWAVNMVQAIPRNTPGKYIDFFRHVVGLLRQYAPMGEVVWCPSVLLPPNAKLAPMGDCYPGTDWVDWAGLDGYITGNLSASGPNRPFADLFSPSVEELARIAPNKDVLIVETGVNPALAAPYPVDWLLAIPGALAGLPSVRGVCLFDNQQSIVHNEPERSAVVTLARDARLAGPLTWPKEAA